MNKYLYYMTGIAILGYIYFNRNPNRQIPFGDNITAPCDGTIISIKNNKIEFFLGLGDVHYQRAPQSGIVADIVDINEDYSSIELDTRFGPVTIERWAGQIARTVVTYVKVGDRIDKGDLIGRILLGSHCSITIPPDLMIKVDVGQHVLAGETVIAEWQ